MNQISLPLFGRLLAASPLSRKELLTLVATAPNRYKDHYIEKRNGRGRRLISQPTAELKYFQRFLVAIELRDLEVHPAAVAYRKGFSVVDHAAPHAGSRYLLKLDFKDFFPSLKVTAFKSLLSAHVRYSDAELDMLGNLLFRRPSRESDLCLSIGAPISPFISNWMMVPFDNIVGNFCRRNCVAYTRYADDLAFSTSEPRLLDAVHNFVRDCLMDLQLFGLALNDSKTVNVSTKFRRSLVGLTIANSGSVSIGRDQKRKLRAAVHSLSQGRVTSMGVARLKGLLANIYSVDPEWVVGLCRRYGFACIEDIALKEAK